MGINRFTITAQLIAGSEEIDRKKREIATVVGMLSGLVRGNQKAESTTEITESWYIDTTAHPHPVVAYYKGQTLIYTSRWISQGSAQMSLIDVEEIHRSLPWFVDGMFKKFPELESATAPLISAAESVARDKA